MRPFRRLACGERTAATDRTAPLNYRHAFHAGNFADLVKHALLLAALEKLTHGREPLLVLDTHAGAGVYDLADAAAHRSGEAEAGIAKLMGQRAPPPALQRLVDAVHGLNGGAQLKRYPGSPWLATQALGARDGYVGCELRVDDRALLERALAPRRDGPNIEVLGDDGYLVAAHRLEAWPGRTLLLIDPPYERADDYARVAALIARRPAPARQGALIWTPLKDLETFDAFLGALEAGRPASLVVAQTRLRPLHDPMQMNGCAVVLVDAPDLSAEAEEVCGWAASHLGGPGAQARVTRLA